MGVLWKKEINIGTLDTYLSLQREGDFFLVERFESVGFKKKQLASLNRCRIFLQIITAANAVNGLGNNIYKDIYMGQKNSY